MHGARRLVIMIMFERSRVFVSGNTGFKGRWLCAALQHYGAHVFGYSLDPNEASQSSTHFKFSPFVEGQYYGDIADTNRLEQVLKEVEPDFIFHLSANAIVSHCFQDPIGAFMTNCVGTLSVLEAVRKLGLEDLDMVLITSDKVYENVGWPYGYREIDKLGADDIYAGSKSAAELGIRSFINAYRENLIDHKIRITVARAGNVFGGGDFSEKRLIPDILKCWYKGSTIELRNPRATRPWQHVLDVVRGYMVLAKYSRLSQDFALGEQFNFGPSDINGVAVSSVVESLQAIVGKINPSVNAEMIISEEYLEWKEQELLALSPVKAAQRLDWVTSLSLDESLALTVEWFDSYFGRGYDLTLSQVENYFVSYD